jgi:hypothetical protein
MGGETRCKMGGGKYAAVTSHNLLLCTFGLLGLAASTNRVVIEYAFCRKRTVLPVIRNTH